MAQFLHEWSWLLAIFGFVALAGVLSFIGNLGDQVIQRLQARTDLIKAQAKRDEGDQ